MADAIAVLERFAADMYEENRGRLPRDPFGNVKPTWEKLSNHLREIWRDRALASIRSSETLADELRREERERSREDATHG